MIIALRFLLIVIVATLGATALVLVARATRSRHGLTGTGDVETAYITATSTLYGIFIAFMIFSVWVRFNEAREAIDTEASTMADLYRMAGGLPEPDRTALRNIALNYGHSVIDYEWKTMRGGRSSKRTLQVVRHGWQLFNTMGPSTVSDSVLRDHLLTTWTKLAEERRVRMLRASTGLSDNAYWVLVVGALITVALACVFTVENLASHILKASALASIIALMLLTIWELDHPFRSRVHLQPTSFVRVLNMLQGER